MLIDNTYFYSGITKIAGIGKQPIDGTVEAYIQQYEPEFLTQLLGYELYDLMINNQSDERFVKLISGDTFVNHCGNTVHYKGLKYSYGAGITTVYYSMIANYVYWHYLRDNAVQLGTTGTSVTNTENADRIAPIYKQTPAWNAMVDQVRTLRDYLHHNADTYPEYKGRYADCSLTHYQNNFQI